MGIVQLNVLVDAAVTVHRATFEQLVGDACRSLHVKHTVVWGQSNVLREPLSDRSDATLVLLRRNLDVAALHLAEAGTARGTHPLVRFDMEDRERDRSPQVTAHIRGLGLAGIGGAVAAAVHAARHPAMVVRYGDDDDQFGEFRRARGAAEEAQPVAVLIHGGYWRSRWRLDLMDAAAIDLADRGVSTWNLEYRRPDRHGWPATLDDIHAGVAEGRRLASGDDAGPVPVAIVGHSAGGQLALQVAEECATAGDAPTVVVSLAGVVDLEAAAARNLSDGAVRLALGGSSEQVPERYLAASAMSRPRRTVPTLIVQGTDDDPDLLEMNRRFTREATAASAASGALVATIEAPGNHFAVIDPSSAVWASVADALVLRLADA